MQLGSESVQHSGGCAVNSVCGEGRECALRSEALQHMSLILKESSSTSESQARDRRECSYLFGNQLSLKVACAFPK